MYPPPPPPPPRLLQADWMMSLQLRGGPFYLGAWSTQIGRTVFSCRVFVQLPAWSRLQGFSFASPHPGRLNNQAAAEEGHFYLWSEHPDRKGPQLQVCHSAGCLLGEARLWKGVLTTSPHPGRLDDAYI